MCASTRTEDTLRTSLDFLYEVLEDASCNRTTLSCEAVEGPVPIGLLSLDGMIFLDPCWVSPVEFNTCSLIPYGLNDKVYELTIDKVEGCVDDP